MKNRIAVIVAAAVFMMTGCQSNAGNSEDTKALEQQIAQLEQQVSDLERMLAAGTISVTTEEDAQDQAGTMSGSDAQSALENNLDNTVQSQEDNRNGSSIPVSTEADNSQQPQSDTKIENSQQPQNDTKIDGNIQQYPNDANAGYNHVPGHDESTYHNAAHSSVRDGISGQQSTLAGIGTTYTIEDLSSMVESFVTRANAAVPSGTASQDMEQFFAFKQEEKQIDDLLDQHEDELEYLYKKQSLTRDAYKELERELDRLDDKLDAAKDQLEFVFGIDD